MALNNLGVGFIFTARDRASGTIRGVGNAFDQTATRTRLSSGIMQAGLLGVGVGIAAMATGLGTLRAAFGLAQQAGEFGQTMAFIGAVTNSTSEGLERLTARAIQAGIETQFSPQMAAEGLRDLTTAGQTARQAMTTLGPTLDLAAGGMISVSDAATSVVGTLNSYSLGADQATSVTDRLLRITQLTNFQARDFGVGLSRAAAAGGQFGTSLNDTIITVGLLRNRNIDASSASTAFRESIRRVASDQRAQQILTREGVTIFDDQTGSMLSLVDIMQQTAEATRDMTDEERNRIVTQAFGARGLLAFNAVANATFTETLPDGTENVLRGEEAIARLRNELDDASGTAERFREALLDTFEGQQTLLAGTLETLQTVTGGAFARVFSPFVSVITNMLNLFIRVFQAIPAPIQTVLAALVVAIGFFTTGIGGAIALGFGIAIIIPFLKVIAITLAIVAVAFAPVIIGVGALVVGVIALAAVVRSNVGGIGDTFRETFGRVKTVAEVLFAFLSGEEVEGELLEEFLALPPGFRAFVESILTIGGRIMAFFTGIGTGFESALEAGQPAIDAFMGALTELGEALGFITEGVDAVAGTTDEQFGAAGESVGAGFGDAVIVIIDALRMGIQFVTGFIERFRQLASTFEPVIAVLTSAFGAIGDALGDLFGQTAEMGTQGREGASGAEIFGRIFTDFVVPAIQITILSFAIMIRIIALVIQGIADFVRNVRTGFALVEILAIRMAVAWENMGDRITVAINGVLLSLLGMLDRVPAPVRNALGLGAGSVGGVRANLAAETSVARQRIAARTAVGARLAAEALPATAETQGRAQEGANVAAAIGQLARSQQDRPVQVRSQLVVDGEVLASSVGIAARATAAGGFESGGTTGFGEA